MRFLATLFFALLLFSSCKENKNTSPVKRADVTFIKHGELKLLKKETDSIVAILDIEIADDEYKTQTGLMYRSGMEDNQAMLFIFPDEQARSFYMKDTQFALDIIYANANREIVSFQKNARPYNETSLPSGQPAQYVLEVNAGLSDHWGLEEGDILEWQQH
jgi:uncharacterized membrane protein (UPF0127 family)